MSNQDNNWNNLFGEYTTDETAWHGQWVTYSPNQKVTKNQRVVRRFRSNADNTVITHINRYIDASGNVEEKTWQIDRDTCNKPDEVIHPARSWMRALAIGANAMAWVSQKLIPGSPFRVHFPCKIAIRERVLRSCTGKMIQLNQILHVRKYLGH